MYVDVSTVHTKKKSYTRYLLRESFRENGKVKHRTIANLSHCKDSEIEAIRLALRHKKDLSILGNVKLEVAISQGKSIGALWVVYSIAKKLGIDKALGPSRNGKLALWQIIARVIDQGSRLSAVRLASKHSVCDVLGLDSFDEDNLYDNLDWLCDNQTAIEERMFNNRYGHENNPDLYLYDVTSSYLEGTENELATFGYSRDGKKGKLQIVIGLLCDNSGYPVSVEVFHGNTQDPKTVSSQLKKLKESFGAERLILVGDRGMIKSKQINEITSDEYKWNYITAITKPQIETLLKKNMLQMDLFDEEISEVDDTQDGIRYVLRRNPVRCQEIRDNRKAKIDFILKKVEEKNQYLDDHGRASSVVAVREIKNLIDRRKLKSALVCEVVDRKICCKVNEEKLAELSKLDGCYVMKSDVPQELADKNTIHDRYKDLALVEWAFRSSKTGHLEIRPIYVRKEKRTRGHVFIVSQAYKIIKELASRWNKLNITVEEGLKELSALTVNQVQIKGRESYSDIPAPRQSSKELLKTAGIRLPKALSNRKVEVSTKKKLQTRRKGQ